MIEKILKIFDEYSRKKAGYLPLADREPLAEKIDALYRTTDPPVDWSDLGEGITTCRLKSQKLKTQE